LSFIERFKGGSVKWFVLGAIGLLAGSWVVGGGSGFPATVGPAAGPVFDPGAVDLVRAAIAAERMGDTAQARAGYLEAAKSLPPIEDYLRLRAAALTADSDRRRELYRAITTSPARELAGPLEAKTLESLGDLGGAIAKRGELGQFGDVFRLRLQSAPTAETLAELVRWINDSAASPARAAVAAAALPYATRLSADQLIQLARASVVAGANQQAVSFFTQSAARGARLTPDDHAGWGQSLYSLGRYREAATRLGRVSGGTLVARSMLFRGRSLLRAGQSGGKPILDDVIRRFPDDSSAAPAALFILGDLARDRGDYVTARRHWSALGTRFPHHELAPRARFLHALSQYTGKRFYAAAAEWDSLFLNGGREEALAAGYWSGRAWLAGGDRARARERWDSVAGRSPLSYYTRLARRRLGAPDSAIVPGFDSFPAPAGVADARRRLELLAQAGMNPELLLETSWLAGQAGTDLSVILGTAALLRDHNRATLSAQLGWRALGAGSENGLTYRLIFPVHYDSALVRSATDRELDPALVAALIRQESLFDSMATSRAGARGLMQIMPAVGRQLAREARQPSWNADSLYHPRINLQLGTAHLAWSVRRYGGIERTLAAYNAGGGRVTRWARYPGAGDPEVFVEWIPFPETRSYVRTVMRNYEFYRGLYTWK
jgi:soluble lytic murein transglycosylase-like protein